MSSKRQLRKKACSGKVKFDNGVTATMSAISLSRKHKTLITAYQCKYCGGWHIGHAPHRVKQSIRDRKANA